MEDVLKKFPTRLVGAKHYVFNVVTTAILSCHPMTALLLGLTGYGKENLRRDLTKLLHDDNNGTTDKLVQINLSQCSDYDDFFKLMYDLFGSLFIAPVHFYFFECCKNCPRRPDRSYVFLDC